MNVRDLRARHWGRRCWVLCNGPSLAGVDLGRLAGEVTIGMNAIYLARGFRPSYHLVEDRLFAEDHRAEVNALRGPAKVYPADLAHLLNGRGTRYVDFRGRGAEGEPRFSVDAGEVVWWGGTVTYFALQMAYYLGCGPVCIVGADHHMVVPRGARVEGNVVTSAGADPNHFDPGYFGRGKRWHKPNWALQEAGYARARRAFEAAGREVLNCTVGGRLEVFRRADWQEVLAS